jgi:hypothetical protein
MWTGHFHDTSQKLSHVWQLAQIYFGFHIHIDLHMMLALQLNDWMRCDRCGLHYAAKALSEPEPYSYVHNAVIPSNWRD